MYAILLSRKSLLRAMVLTLAAASLAPGAHAQGRKLKAMLPPGGDLAPLASLSTEGVQNDFPAIGRDASGTIYTAYIAYDGQADSLRLARLEHGKLVDMRGPATAANVYQPGLALDGAKVLWCVWSQMDGADWNLYASPIRDGVAAKKAVVADGPGNDILPDVKTDSLGRLWVAWQYMESGAPHIRARYYTPASGAWSELMQITHGTAGDWEPRLAFGGNGEALIVFDSYRNGNFDVFLARVAPGGAAEIHPMAASERYEGRAEAELASDGQTLWIAYEDGVKRWGKDLGSEWRATGGGLQYDRHIYLCKYDLATNKSTRVADITGMIPGLPAVLGETGSNSICLPEIVLDADGNPWLFYRFGENYWEIAFIKYDVRADRWSLPIRLGNSSHCMDRRNAVLLLDNAIYAAWPSDSRQSNDSFTSAINVARAEAGIQKEFVARDAIETRQKTAREASPQVNATPERPRGENHTWEINGKKYTLYFGDLHRHTDFSNCRACDDGCILEHYRYAFDAAGLDYVATTDHTDQSKSGYSPYEWWQTQKLAEMFDTPGYLLTFYAYEREQARPYGHRNIVFTERGGPIVYNSRERFADSPWSGEIAMPGQEGAIKGELAPWQLWSMLRDSGQRATAIPHTPAGDDWSLIAKVDGGVEQIMEIYQGSRMSYEGPEAPQPAVAAKGKDSRFGESSGVFQDAISRGHKYGVFASSDHRSTNISFGGLYAEDYTRDSLFDAIEARRSIAATDKIFMDFSCNGHPLGEIFETREKPFIEFAIAGTAPIARVTLIRNEKVLITFQPGKQEFQASYEDATPEPGENRYYMRVEQTDGNMGWTSPVWVTMSE